GSPPTCHFLYFLTLPRPSISTLFPYTTLFRSRLFLLVLILLLMPTLNFLPVWFALSLLRFRLPSRLPMMFILWMVGTEEDSKRTDRKSGSAGMPRPSSYAFLCLKKKTTTQLDV